MTTCHIITESITTDGITCDGGSHSHGHRHQAQQESDGLGHIFGSDQLKGNGSHDADEATVKQAHQQAHSDQPAEDVAHWDHHGHEADDEEGRHLEGQERGGHVHFFSSFFFLYIYE